jgi:Bacterial Ig-like domain
MRPTLETLERRDLLSGIAPVVVGEFPRPNARPVSVNVDPSVKFNIPVIPATVSIDMWQGKTAVIAVPGSVSVSPNGLQATFTPTSPLLHHHLYTVEISAVYGTDGVLMYPPTVFTFKTR